MEIQVAQALLILHMKDDRDEQDSGQILGEIMQDFKIDWEKRGEAGKSSIIVPRFMNSNIKNTKIKQNQMQESRKKLFGKWK